MTKIELFEYIKNNGHGNYARESYFREHFVDFYDDFLEYSINFPQDFSFHQKLYHYFLDDKNLELGKCKECGNRCHFLSLSRGYRGFCCNECKSKSEDVKTAVFNTKLERYGDGRYNNFGKAKSTNLEKYGVEYPMQVKEFSEKQHNACQEHIEETVEKIKATNMERYGYATPMENPEFKERFKISCLKNHGVEYPFMSQKIRDKSRETILNKFGKEHYPQTQKFKDIIEENEDAINQKRKNTNLERFDVEHYFQTDEFKNTTMDKIEDSNKKLIETNLSRFSQEFYPQTQDFKDFIHQNKDDIYKKKCENIINSNQQTGLTEDEIMKLYYKSNSEKGFETRKKNGTLNTSSIESSFGKYLDDNNFKYQRQYKDERYPYACDFYLPDYDLFIEIQGSWTHGKHAFDSNDELDIITLNEWKSKQNKYYDNAINTWIVRDVEKRNIAKQNNINYLEIFTNDIEVCVFEFNNYLKSLI